MMQLWADTFMMHEDEFPNIMSAYRLLRQEGYSNDFLINLKGLFFVNFFIENNLKI